MPAEPLTPAALRAARDAVVQALTVEPLTRLIDFVAYPQGDGPERTVVVVNRDGASRLEADGSHTVLAGRDPVAWTDPMAFLPYDVECADPSPDNERNAYPEPGRRLRSLFDDPTRSPDLVVVHAPRHYFPDEGGHRGEHGSLDVVQSRAPFLLSGAGVSRRGMIADHARILDVTPTLLLAAGVDGAAAGVDGAAAGVDGTAVGLGARADMPPMEGRARADLAGPGAPHVMGLLWDGAHCSDLLALAAAGELPGVARLLDQGLALTGGAVAEFPSVTLCNHTSALTGVGPGRHGVIGNVFFDRATGERVVPNDASTWHRSAEWLRPGIATVFERLTASRPDARTACVNEAVDRGARYSTMQVIRASGGSRGAAGLEDALPDAAGSPYVGNRDHLDDDYYRWSSRVDDAGLTQMLTLWESQPNAPQLTWWATVVTDAGHHAGGPRSRIARDSLRDADRRLQAFLEHLDRLGVVNDVAFLLTADHGFETADEAVTGSWRSALEGALGPLGVSYRDEGPGFVYLGC